MSSWLLFTLYLLLLFALETTVSRSENFSVGESEIVNIALSHMQVKYCSQSKLFSIAMIGKVQVWLKQTREGIRVSLSNAYTHVRIHACACMRQTRDDHSIALLCLFVFLTVACILSLSPLRKIPYCINEQLFKYFLLFLFYYKLTSSGFRVVINK